MDLRDWFAGQVLQGLLASEVIDTMDLLDWFAGHARQTFIARQRTLLADDVKDSYEVAHLMMKQRKEVPNE
jgi:hypothetical protein